MTEIIACNLHTLSAGERRRRSELATLLKVEIRDVATLPNGYAFHLERVPGSLRRIEELIELEGRCCSFIDMKARLDADGEGVVVEMTGGDGVKAFVASEFGIRGKLDA